jgi:hypothetical protein
VITPLRVALLGLSWAAARPPTLEMMRMPMRGKQKERKMSLVVFDKLILLSLFSCVLSAVAVVD